MLLVVLVLCRCRAIRLPTPAGERPAPMKQAIAVLERLDLNPDDPARDQTMTDPDSTNAIRRPSVAAAISFERFVMSRAFLPKQASGRQRADGVRKIRRPSPSAFGPRRVQRGWWSGSTCRSGWGIRPKIRPVGSQRPATAPGEPLGLAGIVLRRPARRVGVAEDDLAGGFERSTAAGSASEELALAVGDGQLDRLGVGQERARGRASAARRTQRDSKWPESLCVSVARPTARRRRAGGRP